MKYTALVVEHDSETIDTIVDILDSLGHKFDTVHSQSEAMKRVLSGEYSYILLNLEIPARTRTGRPRIQNTENFLERLGQEKNGDCPPVIVMSAHTAENVDRTVKTMRMAISLDQKGATDFIGKPFPTAGRTLDRVIKKVLGINGTPVRKKAKPKSVKTKMPRRKSLGKKESSPAIDQWLTVTQAAEMLLEVVSGIDLPRARARVSRGAQLGKFKTNDRRGKARRVERASYSIWLLEQREKDLIAVDNNVEDVGRG